MKFKVTGPYGELAQVHGSEPHHGIDLAMGIGTKLRSVGEGVVGRVVDYGDKNIGQGVIIHLKNGEYAIYGHMSEVDVKPGQVIHDGSFLGLSGNSGHSSGPHLHFGIETASGQFKDPSPYLNHLEAVSGVPKGGIMDHINQASDWIIGKEAKYVFKPVGGGVQDVALSMWHWLIVNLPDIMGYGTILFGALIILSSLTGKGRLIKIAGLYGGLLIIAICILGSV
jgi:hypothetical protein